jgi:hypothetical protein
MVTCVQVDGVRVAGRGRRSALEGELRAGRGQSVRRAHHRLNRRLGQAPRRRLDPTGGQSPDPLIGEISIADQVERRSTRAS